MKKKTAASYYIYHTHGVCPPEIHLKLNGGKIKDLRFVGGGCPGNAQLISRLLEGKRPADVLGYLKGIECRNDNSCPQELAGAILAIQNGSLATAQSFRVHEDDVSRRSIALIGNLAGNNEILLKILDDIQGRDADAIVCMGDITGNSPHNRNVIKTIQREEIITLQGENDWRYSKHGEAPVMPHMEPKLRDWLLQLPQVLSFRLNNRKGMAFCGDFIQSFTDYSDFEPFALEMNMVCGLADFMRDETVFPALTAMIPQFQADIIIFSQLKTWGSWHVAGKDFFSVGAAMDTSGLSWGLLEESNGQMRLKILRVKP